MAARARQRASVGLIRRALDDELVATLLHAQHDGDLSAAVDPVVAKHTFWAIVNDLPNWYRAGRLTADEVADQIVILIARSALGFEGDDSVEDR